MPLSAKSLYCFSPRLLTFTALFLLCGALQAQMGVAPSQTGMFFNDIRLRADQVRTGAANTAASPGTTTSTEGIYTYDQNQYTGQPIDQRALGNPLGLDAVTRQVGTPLGSGPVPTSYSRRLAGDYSGYNGPYPSTNTFFAPTYVSDPFLAGRRNVKLGPVNIGLGLTAAIEYNDNVLRASNILPPSTTANTTTTTNTTTAVTNSLTTATSAFRGKISDFIGTLFLNVDANYPISESNRLTLTASIGFNHYFSHPEVSPNGRDFNMTVLPGTSLAFDMRVGHVVFVFYDRMSVRPASNDQFALDNADVFGVFENDAGIAMNWAINSELNLSLNFNRSDSYALQDLYKRFNRTVQSVSGSLAWTPSGTWTVGLEGSFSNINYEQEFNNDGNTLSGGVFVVLPLTHHTYVRVAGGIQSFDFKRPPNFTRTVSDQDLITTQNSITTLTNQIAAINVSSSNPAQAQASQAQLAALQTQLTTAQNTLTQQTAQKAVEDTTFNSRTFDTKNTTSDPYYNVVISNQLNPRVSQQLAFGHETSLNTTSNFITADYVSYGLGIIAWRGARFTLSGFYENAEESGGNLRENTKQYGFDVNLIHRLGEHLTAGVGYHFGNTDSNLPDRDYDQHAFTADLSWQLSGKWSAGIGYRFWKTVAVNPTQSFTQNRIILSTNYNF